MTNRAPTPSQPGSNLEDPVALLREAARLLREPGSMGPISLHDTDRKRVHQSGFGWLSLFGARRLASELLSAADWAERHPSRDQP